MTLKDQKLERFPFSRYLENLQRLLTCQNFYDFSLRLFLYFPHLYIFIAFDPGVHLNSSNFT